MKELLRHISFGIVIMLLGFGQGQVLALPVIHTINPNSTTIARYDKLELSVSLSAIFSNPFDYGQLSLQGVFVSPGGQQYFMDGFYYQNYEVSQPNVLVPIGSPGWRIRFAPNQTGLWTYYIKVSDASGTTTSANMQFTCVASEHKGFVKRSGAKMVYDNGETFHGLGTNLAFQWWWDGWAAYEDWINALAENGGDFTKLTMAPWIFEIEWTGTGLGNYTQRMDRAWVLDWVMDQLAEKNIYTTLNPMIHDELRTNSWTGWEVNPYNDDNGGPCPNPQDFFTNPTAIQYYKRKLRYINARWGWSPQVAAWEHLSEADNTGLYNDYYNQTLSWLTTMNTYMSSLDVYQRPLSAGYAIPQHDPYYWNDYNTGISQAHVYDFIPDLEMAIYNMSNDYITTWNKPFYVGEFSLGHNIDEILALDPQGIAFHNSAWASMFSGSAASAMSWYWDNYLYPNNLFDYLEPISDFMQLIDADFGQLQPAVPLSTSIANDNISVFPGYNNENGKAPENYFHYEPSGFMYPTDLYLGRYLYGSFFNGRKNPPTFKVNYTRNGEFKVHTKDVYFSKLKVKIDGNTVYEQSVGSNNTYTIFVPAGIHEIRVENSGTGILRVGEYEFGNYAPMLRTFVLKNEDYAAGWMQNRRYNWSYINQFGTPQPVSQGIIKPGFDKKGVYDLYWYNGQAELDSVQRVFNTANALQINAPPILWDGAFEVKYISPISMDFTATPLNGLSPLTVQFTNQSVNNGATIDSWHWDFGDGQSSALQHPQHIYQSPGIYTVSLEIVSGAYTNTLEKENYISVAQALVAEFSADTTKAFPNGSIHFNDLSLGEPTNWLWTFGDNTLSFASNPNHIYENPGNYTVSLFIQKGTQNAIKTKTNYIEILTPLQADFTADKSLAVIDDTIFFTDNSLGNPTSWNWDFGNGATSSEQNPGVSYSQFGSFTVSLTVSTPYQTNSISIPSYIEILEPLDAEFVANTPWAWMGLEVEFYDFSTGQPDTWLWDFGDGGHSNQQNPTYTYPQSGTYSVSLQIADVLQVDSETKEAFITVRDSLDAEFTVDTTIAIRGKLLHFTDLSKGDPLAWNWSFGDGFASNLQNPSHKYTFADDFTVALTVSRNDSTNAEIKENYIKVVPPILANFKADTLIARPGEAIHLTDLSNGNANHWVWDFGNFVNSPLQNPVVSYQSPGIYTITLIAYNQYTADTVTKQNYITIIPPLVANFTVNPFEAKMGQSVHFYDLSTGNPNQWEWWPGNGDTLYTKNPFTTYNEPGLYDVSLIAKNNFLSDTLTIQNFLYVLPPFYNQDILLKKGWNGISSYLRPVFPNMDALMDPIADVLFYAANEEGIYSPPLDINTLQSWNTNYGLLIYVDDDAMLHLEGYQENRTDIVLEQGWSLLPVFTRCEMTCTEFAGLLEGKLNILKEVGGYRLFWPNMGISTLDSIQPGKMYHINLHQPAILQFPECE